MSSPDSNQPASVDLTSEEMLARFRLIDELYVIGKKKIYDGFTRDHPDATEDQLQEMWMAYLEERHRGTWSDP